MPWVLAELSEGCSALREGIRRTLTELIEILRPQYEGELQSGDHNLSKILLTWDPGGPFAPQMENEPLYLQALTSLYATEVFFAALEDTLNVLMNSRSRDWDQDFEAAFSHRAREAADVAGVEGRSRQGGSRRRPHRAPELPSTIRGGRAC